MAMSYGSGLPVEFTGDRDQAIAQYGQRIVDRVDFATGRVRPNLSWDALNVINFAGLFSGTALAPPRSVAMRLQFEF